MDRNAIVDLGKMYLNNTLPKQFSQDSEVTPNDALRAGFNKIMGLTGDNKVISKKALRAHKVEVFAILEEIIQETVHEGLTDVLEGFVEYRNLALGDTNEFIVPDNKYFRVATISDGNGNLRRQRMRDGQSYQVPVHIKGVKIYEEFVRWMAGRIDFLEMIRIVGESMVKEVKSEIYSAVLTNFREGGAGTVLQNNGAGVLTWVAAGGASSTDLTNSVTGILPVANGGTGLSSGTSGGIPYFSAVGAITSSGVSVPPRDM